jgi:hypothetical protein
MGSSGKKKTTMAKLARESRLRERRLDKAARKDARKQAASEPPGSEGPMATPGEAANPSTTPPEQGPIEKQPDEALPGFLDVDAEPEPGDPRAKEVALMRLRNSADEELAVFGSKLRDGALEAGASEREMRDAQRDHPGHGG